jgi:uncharacterized protein YjbI with pentapeptide repeats
MKTWQKWLDGMTAQRVGLLLLALSIVTGVTGYIHLHPGAFNLDAFLADFYTNISSEFASIAMTVLIIDTLNRRREEKASTEREREQLIRQLGSTVNEIAKHASEELRAQGWLIDGSLQERDLRVANLEDARLWKADLQGVNLQWAKLNKANLNGANLVGANLLQAKMTAVKMSGADLRGAKLAEARLYRANFQNADLRDADFSGAYLQGARFDNADLTGAILDGALMDEFTTCPDGCAWSQTTDLARFTNAAHPTRWQPTAVEPRELVDTEPGK